MLVLHHSEVDSCLYISISEMETACSREMKTQLWLQFGTENQILQKTLNGHVEEFSSHKLLNKNGISSLY